MERRVSKATTRALGATARLARPPVRRVLLGVSSRRAKRVAAEWLARPAVVFSPHPDDETLGCGGTIILKRRAGADVKVVFFSDGAESRPGLVEPEEFGRVRRRQALAACAALGVEARSVDFLDIPYGEIAANHAHALERVRDILRDGAAGQAFVSYRRDGHPDHDATGRIVAEAVKRGTGGVELLEFPVWLWHHWPWVGLRRESGPTSTSSADSKGGGTDLRGALDGAWRTRVGWRLAWEFDVGVNVGGVLHEKRAALACHASELDPLSEGQWSLSTAAASEFLPWMLRPVEVFRRSWPARGTRRRP